MILIKYIKFLRKFIIQWNEFLILHLCESEFFIHFVIKAFIQITTRLILTWMYKSVVINCNYYRLFQWGRRRHLMWYRNAFSLEISFFFYSSYNLVLKPFRRRQSYVSSRIFIEFNVPAIATFDSFIWPKWLLKSW